MEDGVCTITKPSDETFEPIIAYERNGLFSFGVKIPEKLVTLNGSFLVFIQNRDLWHARLGHPGKSISDAVLKNNPAIGISDSKNMDEICDICVRRKLSRKGFAESKTRTTEVLQLVHSDLCEVRVPSLNKNRYVLCFVDDFSREVFVYLLPTKDLVFDRFL